MADVAKLSDKVVENMRKAVKCLKNGDNVDGWLTYINKIIMLINKTLKTKSSNSGNLFKLEANLVSLNYYKELLKQRKKSTPRHLIWTDTESCFNSRIRTGCITNLKYKDPQTFFRKSFRIFKDKITKALEKCVIKVNVVFASDFILPHSKTIELKTFATPNVPITKIENLKQWYQEHVVDRLLNKLSEFESQNSGWSLYEILTLKICINEYCPIAGRSYFELPREIKNKRAVINIKNYDDYCFLWAIVSALYPIRKNSDLVESYPHFSRVLKYDGINFPMQLKNISKFEKLNNLTINVYSIEEENNNKIAPVYISDFVSDKHIPLLIMCKNSDRDESGSFGDKINNLINSVDYHFMWIKDLSRLLSKQISKRNGKIYLCHRCMNHFSTQERLNEHSIDCVKITNCRIILPRKDNAVLKFQNYYKKERVPFVIYADFESILEKVENSTQANTTKINKHTPISVGLYFKCAYDDSLSYFKSYRGLDCQQWFTKQLLQIAEDVEPVFNYVVPMNDLTAAEKFYFENSPNCHICEKNF